MTATIYTLDKYRRVPSVIKQRELVEAKARQQVVFEYGAYPVEIVEIACNEAGLIAHEGGGLDAAMEAARWVVKKYLEFSSLNEKAQAKQ